jgi:hypothetical protein
MTSSNDLEENPKKLKAKGNNTYETSVINLPQARFFKDKDAAGTDCTAPQLHP